HCPSSTPLSSFFTPPAPTSIYPLSLHDALPIYRAISALGRGEFVLVYDADGREAETDLTVASEFVSPAAIRTLRKEAGGLICMTDRKSTRLNSSHVSISYAVFCLKKKKKSKQRV